MPLPMHEEVGPHAGLLAGEEGAGATEAGGDLVGDQQHAVLAAGVGHRPRRPRVRGCGCRPPPGRGARARPRPGRRRAPRWSPPRRAAASGPSRPGHPHAREAQRVEHVGAEAAVAHRERADGVAVVGAAEREVGRAAGDPLVGPVLEGDLEGLLDGRGAVRGEQEAGVVDRHPRGERLGQLDGRHVAVAEERRVGDPVELVTDGLVELGDVVAERGDPQRRDGVEVAAAVDVDELAPLGPLDDHRPVVGEGRHLGEAVPHHRDVALDPGVVTGRGGGRGSLGIGRHRAEPTDRRGRPSIRPAPHRWAWRPRTGPGAGGGPRPPRRGGGRRP